MATEKEAAQELTRFLTTKDGYRRLEPIEEYVQHRIRQLAGDLATEIVQGNPEIRAKLDEMIRGAIRTALSDEPTLHTIVAGKVAQAILKISGEGNE